MAPNPETVLWRPLEAVLGKILRNAAGPKGDFNGSTPCIPGSSADGFKSDGLLTDGKSVLAEPG